MPVLRVVRRRVATARRTVPRAAAFPLAAAAIRTRRPGRADPDVRDARPRSPAPVCPNPAEVADACPRSSPRQGRRSRGRRLDGLDARPRHRADRPRRPPPPAGPGRGRCRGGFPGRFLGRFLGRPCARPVRRPGRRAPDVARARGTGGPRRRPGRGRSRAAGLDADRDPRQGLEGHRAARVSRRRREPPVADRGRRHLLHAPGDLPGGGGPGLRATASWPMPRPSTTSSPASRASCPRAPWRSSAIR